MNKEKKALLEKCIDMRMGALSELPIGGLYIIPTQYKHDSGYKIMYVVGHSPRGLYEEEKLYLLSMGSDVVSFESWVSDIPIKDLNMDISPGGIIHIWSFTQNMKCRFNCSNCQFEMMGER